MTLYKTLNGQLQQHVDDLRRHGPQHATSAASTDGARSEQRLQRIEAAVTRSDEPRSDTLLQLLHSASEGQTAARAAADAAEAELRSVRGALRTAEGQVTLATKRAEDLALQLQGEQRKTRELREQSRCACPLHSWHASVVTQHVCLAASESGTEHAQYELLREGQSLASLPQRMGLP